MKYAIAILTNTYGKDEQANFVQDERHTEYVTYDRIEEAQAVIDDLESDVYVLDHNEAGRPDYYIVDDGVAEYIATGRGYDGSNYNWDDCDCDCGDCDECLALMIDQDRQYIIDNAISE
jgi:hypothetical protein